MSKAITIVKDYTRTIKNKEVELDLCEVICPDCNTMVEIFFRGDFCPNCEYFINLDM